VCVCRSVGVFLAADLSQEELHSAMQKSFALVNSSLSEGMSAAILEVCQKERICFSDHWSKMSVFTTVFPLPLF